MDEVAPETRRSFLDLVLRAGLTVWLAGMLAPAISYLWPARSRGRMNTVSAGPVKGFSAGAARMAQAEGKPILVIKTAEDHYVAFSAICTHLGCIVKWNAGSKQIHCPCHAAVFDVNGKVVSGPPPRPLQRYDVLVSGGEVLVKLS